MQITRSILLTWESAVSNTVGLDILAGNDNACTSFKLLTTIHLHIVGIAFINLYLNGTITLCLEVLAARVDTLFIIVYYNKVFHQIGHAVRSKSSDTAKLCTTDTVLLLGQCVNNLISSRIELIDIGPELQCAVCLWLLCIVVERVNFWNCSCRQFTVITPCYGKRVIIYKVVVIGNNECIVGIHCEQIVVITQLVDNCTHDVHVLEHESRSRNRLICTGTEHLVQYIDNTVVCYNAFVHVLGLDIHQLISVVNNLVKLAQHRFCKRDFHQVVDKRSDILLWHAVKS